MFPARQSLVSDIPAGEGKTANLFYSVGLFNRYSPLWTECRYMEMRDVSAKNNWHVKNDDQCIYNVAMMNVVILGDEINWWATVLLPRKTTSKSTFPDFFIIFASFGRRQKNEKRLCNQQTTTTQREAFTVQFRLDRRMRSAPFLVKGTKGAHSAELSADKNPLSF